MDDEQKEEFIASIKYFWNEKGDIDYYAFYTPEKLREADPVLAEAYERYKNSKELIDRLLS